MRMPDPHFPDRPQGHGFVVERDATRSARDELGVKAKNGLSFVIKKQDDGTWSWIGASWDEYKSALLADGYGPVSKPARSV